MLRDLLLTGFISCSLFGQTYTIKTIAGGSGLPPPPVNVPGVSAGIGEVGPVAVDSAGNVFITSYLFHVVLRLDGITGILTLAAGNGTYGFSGDNGPATSARLSAPAGVAVDSTGNLYIADTYNNRIRKVSNGVITTVAGNGTAGFSGDNGPATSAQLYGPTGVAVDPAGNLYIADFFSNRIRKVSNGVITTVAGNGTFGFSGDNGPATSAQLGGPSGVAVDSAGNLYFADENNFRIRKVSNGVITTVAGNGTRGFSGDNGSATSAQLDFPTGVAVDSAGNLFIADQGNSRIRKVSNGVITTVAGGGSSLGDNGPATSARLADPSGVAVDSAGKFFIADTHNRRIRKVSNGVITTVAGNGTFADDNVPATSAGLSSPFGVAVDSIGNLYIADTYDYRIRKVSNGVITTVAGGGPYSPDLGDNGSATSAVVSPAGVAVDSAGNLYIAETLNYRIRKVSNGVITTVAGNGTFGFSGDNGPATSAQLGGPIGVAVDSAGNLFIADSGNSRIRKVSNGVITTVAGDGTPGFSGDNGPATSAQLFSPYGVAVDSAGNLYIADTYNYRIRKVSNGVITTVAGGGSSDYPDDTGPATSAKLGAPVGIALDYSGNIYIADGKNQRIRKVSNGLITTIAGGGSAFGDNGPALSAQLSFDFYYDIDGNVTYLPAGLAVDANGAVYIPDTGHDRVRILTPFTPPFPVCTVTNAASNHSGAVAPGEIVVIYGPGLGPTQLTQSQLGDNGLVPTQLAGTSVSFNGIPAPILYTSATQVAAVVPYAVSDASAQVTVTYQGKTAAATTVNIVASAPALFTSDGSGKGQAAAVNQDGSLNTAANPTRAGDVITLFATGEGQTTPAGVDGKPASAPLPKPLLPVFVYISGGLAEVQYYGGAPGEVAGVMQVNVKIPSGVSGNVPVQLFVGAASQPGVTIAVSGN